MFSNVARRLGLLVATVICLCGSRLVGQAPIVEEPGYTPTLTFDVAAFHLAPPPDANFHVSVSSPPRSSRFEATNLPLKALLQIAYGYDAPVVGGPEWLGKTLYNLQARSDDAADARLAKLTDNEVRLEKRHAIRVLLAERLGLKTHLETRSTEIYAMVAAKGGVKMQPSPAPPAPVAGEAAPATPVMDLKAHGSRQGLEFVVTNAPMRAVSGSMSAMLEAPVIDRTGLTGTYNYTLQFGREWSANDPEGWPSLFTAVQEQLGLKLDAMRETVPNLVVDHITEPTAN